MKGINTSIFDFPTLRDPARNYVYVDKTAQLYELAKPGADCIYYLPRPRRFGKSLMISTLKALFLGRRELFRGLAIERTDWSWEKEVYPVLHLDMSKVSSPTVAGFEGKLGIVLRNVFEDLCLDYDASIPASDNFLFLLETLPKKSPNGKYVLLIDEYDAPIAQLLDTEEGRSELPRMRKALHDFYVQAKAHCGDMRFLMVTGVSKFAKTSIFSAFNNPCDLTLDTRAADLLGYTHEEMEVYFHDHIQAFADEEGVSYDEMFMKLLDWYDSYQFCPKRLVKVVNPVSFGKALSNRAFANYWEATAGSTLICEAIKASSRTPIDFSEEFPLAKLDAPDALTAPATALLYQGGYLTIEGPSESPGCVRLCIPNLEVRTSLYDGYLGELLGRDFNLGGLEVEAGKTAKRIAEDPSGEAVKRLLVSAYSKLPHDWVCRDEKEAKRYFIAFMVFARAEVVGEEQHSLGRPDAVLRTDRCIYVFEFKYAQSVDAALAQCREKRYADAYAADGRRVVYIGVNYDPNTRTIDDVKAECVQE